LKIAVANCWRAGVDEETRAGWWRRFEVWFFPAEPEPSRQKGKRAVEAPFEAPFGTQGKRGKQG